MASKRGIRNRLPRLRTLGRIVAAALLAVAALAALIAAGVHRTTADLHQKPRVVGPHPAAPEYGSGKLTVAVVLGSAGTTGTDAMAPYEVFATSQRFTVYTVAANDTVAPVEGGPGIVPAYTFDQVDAGKAPPPDVVVVPALEHPEAPIEAPLRDFVRHHAAGGARILSVCNGAWVLAEAGVLDGLRATAHWSRLDALRQKYPDVRWVAGRRYVDATTDNVSLTSTAGISSGIPGALHVMAELAGREEAVRVSKLVAANGWTPQSSTRIPVRSFGVGDVPAPANLTLPWGRPTAGVVLADGITETSVAAEFEVFTVSQTARAVAVTANGWATTRHGMVLAGTPAASVPPLDTHIVLSTSAPSTHAFDMALQRLATSSGTVASTSASKMLEYPAHTTGSAWTWSAARIAALLASSVFAVCLGVGLVSRATRHRPHVPAMASTDGPTGGTERSDWDSGEAHPSAAC